MSALEVPTLNKGLVAYGSGLFPKCQVCGCLEYQRFWIQPRKSKNNELVIKRVCWNCYNNALNDGYMDLKTSELVGRALGEYLFRKAEKERKERIKQEDRAQEQGKDSSKEGGDGD